MAPNTTIGLAVIPGRQKQEDGIMFLAYVDGYGSEKYPVVILRKSANPRYFARLSPVELNIDYQSSAQALINTSIFHKWLTKFDRYISQRVDRKVVL